MAQLYNKSNLSRSIAKGLAANALGQCVTVITQVLQIPILLRMYGAQLTGEWLLLSAIPAYIILSDIGINNVAANAISMHMAVGDSSRAQGITHSLCLFVASLMCVAVLVVGIVAFGVDWAKMLGLNEMTRDQAASVVFLLSIGALISLSCGVFYGVYRGCALGARIMVIVNCARLVDLIGLIITWCAHLDVLCYAALLLVFRILFLAYILWDSRVHCSALPLGFRLGSWGQVLELLRPALFFMFFPLGDALYFQGVTFVVNAAMGASAVVVYNTCRVMSRMVPMLTTILRQTLWIEYPALFAQGELAKIRFMQRGTAGLTWMLIIASLLFLVPMGPQVVALWTGGGVVVDRWTVFILVLVAGVNATWNINSTLLVAINRHGPLSVIYIVCMAAAVLGGYWGACRGGLVALGCVLVLMELPLCVYTVLRICTLSGDSPRAFIGGVVSLHYFSVILQCIRNKFGLAMRPSC